MNKCNTKNYREVVDNLMKWVEMDAPEDKWSNHGILNLTDNVPYTFTPCKKMRFLKSVQ